MATYFPDTNSGIYTKVHPISDSHELCFLKSESTPLQKIGNVPLKIWVCVKKLNGTVERAYCRCFAG